MTGPASGIGRAVPERVARAGASGCINRHGGSTPAGEVVAAITEAGCRAAALGTEVSREGDVARLFQGAASTFGWVDVLVAEAGTQHVAIDNDRTEHTLRRREAGPWFRAQDRRQVPSGTKAASWR